MEFVFAKKKDIGAFLELRLLNSLSTVTTKPFRQKGSLV